MFVGIGFCLWCWWLYPHKIHTDEANLKMDALVLAYNGTEFDYEVTKQKVNADLVLTVDMIEGKMR
jgi:hypothetical protein